MEGEINKETSSGALLILDVREVGSEFIPGGIEEWERGKGKLNMQKRAALK